jgi:cytochrome c oxidase cbb3-type subunit 4
MAIDHDTFVAAVETWGLLFVIALSVAIAIYAYRPSKKPDFDRAANAILDDEDRPWR